MKLGELILEIASIDNHENIPQREMLQWDVEISDGNSNYEVLSFYCDEFSQRIFIDIQIKE